MTDALVMDMLMRNPCHVDTSDMRCYSLRECFSCSERTLGMLCLEFVRWS